MFTSNFGGISSRVLGFYGNDPVCLFKFFVSSDDPQRTFSWTLLTLNFICFGVISISYLIVFIITSTSSSSLSHSATGGFVRNRNQRLQRKISIIILTDFLCWVPFIIICLLHTIGLVDASPRYALLSILILPINSVINPLLYDDTILKILGRIFRRMRAAYNARQRIQDLHILKQPEFQPNLPEDTREQGHTDPPILPDVAREPRHTLPSILLDVAREPGRPVPSILPDVAREPGNTDSSILTDIAGEPGQPVPSVLLDFVRDPGQTEPSVQPDVAETLV